MSLRKRIGLIVPSTNTTCEADFQMAVPPGVTVHGQRLWLTNEGTGDDIFNKMNSEIESGAPYLIAGKTGTAQRVTRVGDDALNLDLLPFHLRHRALMVAFAPADAPRIALAVVVESGGSGSRAAAPVARRILDAWLLGGGGG